MTAVQRPANSVRRRSRSASRSIVPGLDRQVQCSDHLRVADRDGQCTGGTTEFRAIGLIPCRSAHPGEIESPETYLPPAKLRPKLASRRQYRTGGSWRERPTNAYPGQGASTPAVLTQPVGCDMMSSN